MILSRLSRRRSDHGLRVVSRGRLQAPDGYGSLVSWGALPAGVVAIWSAEADQAELLGRDEPVPGGATFPVTRPASGGAVALAVYADSTTPQAVTYMAELTVAHPHVDVLADGSFLVVGARCRWKPEPEGPELNALVIDPSGHVLRRGCLGDGIQHLQVASDGTIWVGYFDEGVFGNFGWHGPGPIPLGAGGIVAWSPDLAKVWELDPQEGLVSDCYTLNVGEGQVTACPYTDFPVVRITGREPDVYIYPTRGVSGPGGVLVDGERIALIGAYRDPWLITLGELRGDSFHETGRTQLRSVDGTELPEAELQCRGPVAHIMAGADWFTFTLAHG